MPLNSTNSGLLGGIGVDRKIKELTKRYGGDDLSVGLLPPPPGLFEYPQGTIRSAPTDRFSGLISGPLDTSMDSGLPSMKSDNQIAREAADQALGLGPENIPGGSGKGMGLFRGIMAALGGKKGQGLIDGRVPFSLIPADGKPFNIPAKSRFRKLGDIPVLKNPTEAQAKKFAAENGGFLRGVEVRDDVYLVPGREFTHTDLLSAVEPIGWEPRKLFLDLEGGKLDVRDHQNTLANYFGEAAE